MQDLSSKKIVLVGAGGHCKSVLDSLKKISKYDEIVITDPKVPAGSYVMGCEVVGGDDILPDLFRKGYREAFITVGSIKNTSIRRRLYNALFELGFSFPSIIDPSANVAGDTVISDGVFVGKNAIVNSGSKIDKFSIINTGAIVEHDCLVGEFSHISVSAVVCGDCRLCENVFIGANATIIQCIRIGENSVIGAGSTILSNVHENSVVNGLWGCKTDK